MRGKLVGLFAVVLLALVGLLGRITYINATSGKKYKKQVLTQAQQNMQKKEATTQQYDIEYTRKLHTTQMHLSSNHTGSR